MTTYDGQGQITGPPGVCEECDGTGWDRRGACCPEDVQVCGACDGDGELDPECRCDLGYACSFPPCVAEREAEMARHGALYAATRPVPGLGTYREQMIDAGRGHLLGPDDDNSTGREH